MKAMLLAICFAFITAPPISAMQHEQPRGHVRCCDPGTNLLMAEGNARIAWRRTYNNWIVEQSEVLPQHRYNFPDGVRFITSSQKGQFELSLVCITRSVEDDVNNFHYHVQLKQQHDLGKGEALFSDGTTKIAIRAKIGMNLIMIAEDFAQFTQVFRLLAEDKKITFSFTQANQTVVEDSFLGSSELLQHWKYCEQSIS